MTDKEQVEAVQFTSDDAAISKLSAMKLGYFKDDFLQYFVPVQSVSQRAPLINRGYYARVAAVRGMIDEFLKIGGDAKKQILSLGAGFDTTYFRLKSEGRAPSHYFEVDFPTAIKKKAEIIASAKQLLDLMHAKPSSPEQKDDSNKSAQAPAQKHEVVGGFAVPQITNPIAARMLGKGQSSTSSADFHMVGADLRDVGDLDKKLTAAGIDFKLPTLVLSECVLVYIKPEHSAAVIQWCAKKFTGGAVFITYEQIHPHDPFGRTMMKNLAQRGCQLLGLEKYPDLKSQEERFLSLGWQLHAAWDMNDVYKYYIPRDDVRRIERIELFDEFEEWHLINAHYCISMASINKTDSTALSNIGLVGRKKVAPKDASDGPLDVTAIRAKFMKNPTQTASEKKSEGGQSQSQSQPQSSSQSNNNSNNSSSSSSSGSGSDGVASPDGSGRKIPRERKPGERRWDELEGKMDVTGDSKKS